MSASFFFFSSRRRHTRFSRDWSSDVCSSDLCSQNEALVAEYLDGLPAGQAAELARVNAPGLRALRGYLADGEAVAFLGAGSSAPLYPLWNELIGELVDSAADQLNDQQVETLRAMARSHPESVVERVRNELGVHDYYEVLRKVLRVRRDRASGRTWTPVQELVCRCNFKAAVTTNYDPGIADARLRVRPSLSATGYTTWQNSLQLDQWRNGGIFKARELPVLYAHGLHDSPDSIVLASTEYRRAYGGNM